MATPEEISERYRVEGWGGGYFSIDDRGCVRVRAGATADQSVSLADVVKELRRRGYRSPFLLRFPQLLQDRVAALNVAFRVAIAEAEYPGRYQGVYPVKVNQQRVVVSGIASTSEEWCYGLEVGSKGELLLALTQDLHEEALLICNGFKDHDYVELALRSAHAGMRVLLIVETLAEVEEILDMADEIGVRPELGLRARLNSQGSGRWQESGGEAAKFGLGTMEILRALEVLRSRDSIDCLRLMHFHVGSQISDIVAIKEAVREAARLYCHLAKRAPSLSMLDIGGGLGIDYDGSSTASDWSGNYDLEEYCRDCVYNVMAVCDQEKVPPPTLVSESGRAVSAFHAVLVISPVKLIDRGGGELPKLIGDVCHQVRELHIAWDSLDRDNWREFVNDARVLHEEVLMAFKSGFVSLEDRASAEALYAAICRRSLELLDPDEEDSDEVAELRSTVAPTLVCNFSVFQSAPDTWALEQVFPMLPLSQLSSDDLFPAILGDITCDSDGTIDRFLGETGSEARTLLLPKFNLADPYDIGVFLVGAYQDTLGDFHNLFGAPNEVAVVIDGPDAFSIVDQHRGTKVWEALEHFGYPRKRLLDDFDEAHGAGDDRDTVRYRDCFLRVLSSGTYLRR